MDFNHTPVLLNECIEGLNINPNATYVDGTLGGGGHSLQICKKLNNDGFLIAIDQDIDAVFKARQVLKGYKGRVKIIHDNFCNIKNIAKNLSLKSIEGVLLDLGVSSYQLDEPSRGFSYNYNSKLDMRMDSSKNFSAYDVINEYDEKSLTRIIYEYGEEKWAKRIASFIIKEREVNKINTTLELVSVIKKAVPKQARIGGPHPAKRTFQAVRIEVNNELGILESAIKDIVDLLSVGGRLCIITFHSLEDRIIKNSFKKLENPCVCPRDFPICMCGLKKKIKIITKKPILPTQLEIEENRRARSSKLRILEKI